MTTTAGISRTELDQALRRKAAGLIDQARECGRDSHPALIIKHRALHTAGLVGVAGMEVDRQRGRRLCALLTTESPSNDPESQPETGNSMPHDRIVNLRIGDQEISDITVTLNAVATAEHRTHYPGGESYISIEFAAVQHVLGLIADQAITAEQARDTLYRLGERLHEANDELHDMRRLEAEWLQ